MVTLKQGSLLDLLEEEAVQSIKRTIIQVRKQVKLLIQASKPDPDAYTLEQAVPIQKSFEPAIQNVLSSYLFTIPEDLDEAAKLAVSMSKDEFVQLSSGLQSEQEKEAMEASNRTATRQAKFWNGLYQIYLNQGLGRSEAKRKADIDPKYRRERMLADAAEEFRERVQKEWFCRRMMFRGNWLQVTEEARQNNVPIPESIGELTTFWEGARNREDLQTALN